MPQTNVSSEFTEVGMYARLWACQTLTKPSFSRTIRHAKSRPLARDRFARAILDDVLEAVPLCDLCRDADLVAVGISAGTVLRGESFSHQKGREQSSVAPCGQRALQAPAAAAGVSQHRAQGTRQLWDIRTVARRTRQSSQLSAFEVSTLGHADRVAAHAPDLSTGHYPDVRRERAVCPRPAGDGGHAEAERIPAPFARNGAKDCDAVADQPCPILLPVVHRVEAERIGEHLQRSRGGPNEDELPFETVLRRFPATPPARWLTTRRSDHRGRRAHRRTGPGQVRPWPRRRASRARLRQSGWWRRRGASRHRQRRALAGRPAAHYRPRAAAGRQPSA